MLAQASIKQAREEVHGLYGASDGASDDSVSIYGVVDVQVRANDQEPTDIVPKLCVIAYYTLLFFFRLYILTTELYPYFLYRYIKVVFSETLAFFNEDAFISIIVGINRSYLVSLGSSC